jgi:carbonic anhydrase/acetyltransferase-like protein (isoleucine patch superfamily)
MDSREYAFEGTRPTVHGDARVSREAVLVGDVTVGAGASVWPGVVLRGDVGRVEVGANSHVGDNAVCHVSTVGERVMVGHGVVCNEATVDGGCPVGANATVNPGVTVGADSVVASGTVIPEDYDVPPESFVRGVPARVTPLSETAIDPAEVSGSYSSGAYTDLASRHEDLF